MRFADTDAMGVVHHANYLAFFESARVEAMRQIGADHAAVVKRGFHLVVIEAQAHYRVPAGFDDLLLIATRAVDIGRVRFAFEYRVERAADAALIATGRTVHACVDARSMRAVRLPAWLLEDLRLLGGS